jgi:predicted nucleic acid-binding protein
LYLVDTNVLSAAAPTKAVPRQDIRDWMDRNSTGLYLSVITVAEIEQGIARCLRTGAHAKAERLAGWLETVLHLYARRVLPVDVSTARRLGLLADYALGQGHAPGLADLAIAATALNRGFIVLTQNLRHFTPLGVSAQDPFEILPSNILL